jgi:hypothetical protein
MTYRQTLLTLLFTFAVVGWVYVAARPCHGNRGSDAIGEDAVSLMQLRLRASIAPPHRF